MHLTSIKWLGLFFRNNRKKGMVSMDCECVSTDPYYYDWSVPPSQKEIDSLVSLLKDFTINIKIPEFSTRSEMHRWKRNVIKEHLDK